MIDMTYDPEADAAYIYLSRESIDHQEVDEHFILDVDAHGRIVGIEILAASKVLAPGEWQKARMPGTASADAAE